MKRILLTLSTMLLATNCWAARDLKEDTAVTIVVGPFVDSAGAAVTGATIASIDCNLYKNDGTKVDVTLAASGSSNDSAHIADGYYSLELTTTDTSTPGYLRISFEISGSLIFHEDFSVLPANIYDSKYSTDKLQVDVAEWLGTAAATPTTAGVPEVDMVLIEGVDPDTELLDQAYFDGKFDEVTDDTGTDIPDAFASLDSKIDTIEAQTDDIGVAGAGLTAIDLPNQTMDITGTLSTVTSVTGLASGAIQAADFASGAIDAAAIAADAIGASEIAASAIASGTEATGFGTAQTGDAFARLGAPAGASVSADIAVIEAQTDDIGTAGVGLSAIPWNASWDAEVQSEAADALTAYDPPTHTEMTAAFSTTLQLNTAYTVKFDPTGATTEQSPGTLEFETP